jgi:hypothetical protein
MPPKRKKKKEAEKKEIKGPLTAVERDLIIAHLERDWNAGGADLLSELNFPGRTLASLSAHIRSVRGDLRKKKKNGFFSFITATRGSVGPRVATATTRGGPRGLLDVFLVFFGVFCVFFCFDPHFFKQEVKKSKSEQKGKKNSTLLFKREQQRRRRTRRRRRVKRKKMMMRRRVRRSHQSHQRKKEKQHQRQKKTKTLLLH